MVFDMADDLIPSTLQLKLRGFNGLLCFLPVIFFDKEIDVGTDVINPIVIIDGNVYLSDFPCQFVLGDFGNRIDTSCVASGSDKQDIGNSEKLWQVKI